MPRSWHTGCLQCDRTDTHTHGARETDGYELRYAVEADGALRLDEVVARGADVHLEQMDHGCLVMIVSLPGVELRVAIAAHGRGAVNAAAEVEVRRG